MAVLDLFFYTVQIFEVILFIEDGPLYMSRHFSLAAFELLVEGPLLILQLGEKVRTLVRHLLNLGLHLGDTVLPLM